MFTERSFLSCLLSIDRTNVPNWPCQLGNWLVRLVNWRCAVSEEISRDRRDNWPLGKTLQTKIEIGCRDNLCLREVKFGKNNREVQHIQRPSFDKNLSLRFDVTEKQNIFTCGNSAMRKRTRMTMSSLVVLSVLLARDPAWRPPCATAPRSFAAWAAA